jgi:hypothetical protein
LVLHHEHDDEWSNILVRISPKYQSHVQDWVVEPDNR